MGLTQACPNNNNNNSYSYRLASYINVYNSTINKPTIKHFPCPREHLMLITSDQSICEYNSQYESSHQKIMNNGQRSSLGLYDNKNSMSRYIIRVIIMIIDIITISF